MNPEPEILSPDIPPSPVPVCGSGAGVPPAVPNSGAYQPPEAEPFPPRPFGRGEGRGEGSVPLPPSSIEQPASDTPDPAAAIEFAHACNGGVPSPPPEERAGLPSIGPAAEGERRPDTSHPARSPRGKIARLPKATRDKLNFMLRDGLEHKDILAQLGDAAKDIIPRNVSNWLASPSYQRWLLEQDWLENLRADQESAFDLTNDFDASKFNEAALQLAVTRLFLAFRHLDSGDLNQKLGGNAQTFARLVHALSRACRETTSIGKYRDACAKAVAAELKQLNVDRDLSDNEFQLLVNKMDQVFKVRRRPNPAPPPTNGSH